MVTFYIRPTEKWTDAAGIFHPRQYWVKAGNVMFPAYARLLPSLKEAQAHKRELEAYVNG